MSEKLSSNLRKSVIQELIQLTREKYVYPEVGEKLANQLHTKLDQGEYDQLTTHGELAAKLTTDLQELSNDHHWAVVYDPQTAVELIDPEEEQDRRHQERYLDAARRANFGFERLERMKGNIGYLDLHKHLQQPCIRSREIQRGGYGSSRPETPCQGHRGGTRGLAAQYLA